MASFCPKCGGEVADGAGFCPACGTSIVAPNTPVAGAGYAPVPPPGAVAAQYASVPAKSGSGLKIVLIVVAIVGGLIAIGVGVLGYAAYKVAHAVTTDSKGNMTLNGPHGGIAIGANVTATEDELGVPIFPGATRGPGGMKMNNNGTNMIMVVYKTTADVGTVSSFYEGKMPGADVKVNDSKHSAVLKKGSAADQITVVISPPAGDDSSGTNIMISRVQHAAK